MFPAAAGEILPDIMHRASPWATMIGGGIGVATMLLVKHLPSIGEGPAGLPTVIGIDILIDGLVLGIGFDRVGPKVGLLLTIAPTIEVLFLAIDSGDGTRRERSVPTCQGRLDHVRARVPLLPIGVLA